MTPHRQLLEPRIRLTAPPTWGKAQARHLWALLDTDPALLRLILDELGV